MSCQTVQPKGLSGVGDQTFCASHVIHFPPFIHNMPITTNGIDSSCPMSSGRDASKASCTSLVYSMKKRAVKIYVRQSPKKNPVPTFCGDFL